MNEIMKKVRIKGREYPCRVTMGAMVRFKRATGKDIREADQQDLEQMLLFVWCCVKSACNADGVEFDMDSEMFIDMLDPEDFSGFFGGMQEADGEKKTDTALKQGRVA